ncbi:DUF6492 family protein [Citricoccus sp. GCM10030269]|uniref:DUF6492 family protein n=1 Tax=Citricoccus sp. GCM10030269 TaxID=3273388 RepID=UPI00361CFD92
MSTLALITPSYRPDLEGFRRLHESVRRFTDDAVTHHVIVPALDVKHFRSIGSDRLRVWTYQEVIPPGLVATDRIADRMRKIPGWPSSVNCAALSRRRPWKPIRGWVLQQIVKMSMAHVLEADVFVNVDSDVVLVRPLSVSGLMRDGAVRLYTLEDAVSPAMERHYRWCRTAHELLGLPWEGRATYPDHVAGLVTWDSEVLRRCLTRIEAVTGEPWAVAVATHLHFSEDILYGTFVRASGSEADRSFQRDSTLCHSYWAPTPMGVSEAERFISGFDDDHVAVHIQSNSDTDGSVVERVLTQLRAAASS